MRVKARVSDAQGHWVHMELPDSGSIESWRKAYKVCSVAIVMCDAMSPSTLALYENNFEERCERYHKTWHLCVKADTICRSEWLVGERRRQENFHTRHPTVSGHHELKPWDSVYREAAESDKFWQKHLMEPALLFERTRGAPIIPAHQT